MNNFENHLYKTIFNNILNYHGNNYDLQLLGLQEETEYDQQNMMIAKNDMVLINRLEVESWKKNIEEHYKHFDALNFLYDLLSDIESKELLTKDIGYRILGPRKIIFPYADNFENHLSKIETGRLNYISPIKISFLNWELSCYDLNPIDYDIKFYGTAAGIFNSFVYHQYINRNIGFVVNKGDVVIDAGACYGDTALQFSSLTGETGKIFSFEFIDENLNIFNKHLEINNINNVEIVRKALWNKSGDYLQFAVNGPASSSEFINNNKNLINVETITIDDLVAAQGLNKIDFIKMDIEGAEINALHGAVNSIKKYKPKLAISLYHKITDYDDIPHFINDLNLNYKYYLKHGSMHQGETVLLCM